MQVGKSEGASTESPYHVSSHFLVCEKWAWGRCMSSIDIFLKRGRGAGGETCTLVTLYSWRAGVGIANAILGEAALAS